MKSASRAGPSTPCSAATISSGTCGSSCRISSARSLRLWARPSMSGVDALGLVDELHARGHERIALQELQHAEALHALADRVMRAVGRRDVAQHVGRGADPVQVVGTRLFDVGLALQQDAERALQARGFLRRGARALAADRERKHHAREQHDVAHRHDDQRVVGQRARRALPPRLRLGRGGCRRASPASALTGSSLAMVGSFMLSL